MPRFNPLSKTLFTMLQRMQTTNFKPVCYIYLHKQRQALLSNYKATQTAVGAHVEPWAIGMW